MAGDVSPVCGDVLPFSKGNNRINIFTNALWSFMTVKNCKINCFGSKIVESKISPWGNILLWKIFNGENTSKSDQNNPKCVFSSSDPDEVLAAYLSLVEQHCIHLVPGRWSFWSSLDKGRKRLWIKSKRLLSHHWRTPQAYLQASMVQG